MFKNRTSKPTSSDTFIKFYNTKASGKGYSYCITGNPTDSTCNVLANCVGYACSRFNEIYAELGKITTMKYPNLNCNAENWVERAKDTYGLKTGSEPKPGAIMVWQKGTLSSSDGAGHVAIVEKVIDSNTVYTSESGYKSKAFWNSTRSNSNGNWGIGSAYKFRCFIYNPLVTDEMIKKESTSCPYPKPTVALNTTNYKNKFHSGTQWIQWHLNKLGYYTDSIDGYFGPKTHNAVVAYQKCHIDAKNKALEVDGSVGPLTREAILYTYKGGANSYTPNPYKEPTVVLTTEKYKNKSFEGVKWAQYHLQRLGYYTKDKLGSSADVSIDGYFGPNTEKAVKLFQTAKKLEVDGRVGPITRKALKNA